MACTCRGTRLPSRNYCTMGSRGRYEHSRTGGLLDMCNPAETRVAAEIVVAADIVVAAEVAREARRTGSSKRSRGSHHQMQRNRWNREFRLTGTPTQASSCSLRR
eukprot:5780678-Prymnesium_polylepis.1